MSCTHSSPETLRERLSRCPLRHIKVAGRVSKRAVYVVLGLKREGNKDLLGLWIGEAESEGAKFWLKVLTDLKNRGLKDMLMACCDGLIPIL